MTLQTLYDSDAFVVLHMVADFMGDYIGLGKITGGPQLAA